MCFPSNRAREWDQETDQTIIKQTMQQLSNSNMAFEGMLRFSPILTLLAKESL